MDKEKNVETARLTSVPMSGPDIGAREIELVNAVLQTPYLSIGPQVERFEKLTAEYVGTAHAAAVNSGTAGLHLCVLAAGIEQGDEVITTPFSFIASANCIMYERARPVFVDIDAATVNLDPDLIESAITSRTKAILPVHAFGQPADMDAICDIARRHNLFVIEDACEAIGAEYKGRRAGTMSDAAVFAFYPNKQMTTGEGGVIVTDRPEWDALFRSLRNQGRDVFDAWLNHTRLGYNYRLDELSAALGVAQLERIEELLKNRERVAQMYNQQLGGVGGITVPYVGPETSRMSWFVYVIRLGAGLQRDVVMEKLGKKGIPSRPYFTPIHLQPFYRQAFGYDEGAFPVTEEVARHVLALPFSGRMQPADVIYVCENLRSIVQETA